MEILGLKETIVEVVKRSGLKWMGHVLRREDDEPVKITLILKVDRRIHPERPMTKWNNVVK